METYKMPKVLVTSGVFRMSRNPIYLGMGLILLGEAIILGTIFPIILSIFFILAIHNFVIPLEEKNLQTKFSKKYLDYKNKVRKWI